MTEPTVPERDLEQRVTNLEAEVSHLRDDVARSVSDAAAARVLAGGADRDVSEMRAELRAHTRLLNALRQTQLEMQTSTDRRFEQVDRRFEQVDTGLRAITGMLQTLLDREGPSADPSNGDPRQR